MTNDIKTTISIAGVELAASAPRPDLAALADVFLKAARLALYEEMPGTLTLTDGDCYALIQLIDGARDVLLELGK